MRYRARVAYDGGAFGGWQRQARRPSVQATLEGVIGALVGAPVAVVGAGRTDAGVHAIGQVIHFDAEWGHSPAALGQAINAGLPREVALHEVAPAAPGFHARHDAIGRRYIYNLWVAGDRPPPFLRRTVLPVAKALCVSDMIEAARRFEGTHDLAAFGAPMRPGGVTVRRIDRCGLRARPPWVAIEVAGNAFLRHQVRRMVGVLLDVGRGASSPEAVSAALAGDPRAVKPRRVPPQGLVLVAVRYPDAGAIAPEAVRDAGMEGT